MADRDWSKDWLLCQKATPGPWWYIRPCDGEAFIKPSGPEIIRYQDDELDFVNGMDRFGIVREPHYRNRNGSGRVYKAWGQGRKAIENDMRFIAEAREALPYWLQRAKELEDFLRWLFEDENADLSSERLQQIRREMAETDRLLDEILKGTGRVHCRSLHCGAHYSDKHSDTHNQIRRVANGRSEISTTGSHPHRAGTPRIVPMVAVRPRPVGLVHQG